MKKCLLLVFTLALAVLPAVAFATYDLVQEGCRSDQTSTTTVFAIANFNSPVPIADLHLIPENPVPGCHIIGCDAPAGWACALNPANLGVDYTALDPAQYVTAGQAKHGFTFTLDPEICCYIVQFTGPQHEILYETEVCFTCVHVDAAPETWGNVKQLFR